MISKLLILVAVSSFEAFRTGDWPGRRAGIVFWAAAALAVLAKGPVGLLLPLGIALATLAFDREIGRWRSFAPFAGPLAFVAITIRSQGPARAMSVVARRPVTVRSPLAPSSRRPPASIAATARSRNPSDSPPSPGASPT